MTTTPPVVQATGVTKRYGSTVALNRAHITVEPGQTHALVGRNGAGKSTLVSVLTGLQAPDEGTIAFGGQAAPRLADRDGWRRRVACVYQKSTIIGQLTVAENLFLNRHDRHRGLISWRTVHRRARDLLAAWSVAVDAGSAAADLSVEQRQFVEIARALSFGARFIILDEPTAQLDGAAITRLFDRIRGLQEQGVTFLFISHHLEEVYEICDTVTVFRDARHILTAPVAEVPRAELVAAMTGEAARLAERSGHGRAGAESFVDGDGGASAGTGTGTGTGAETSTGTETAETATDGQALSVAGLTATGAYHDVWLTVRPGEIVGLAGAASSGRTEVAETVAGLRTATGGQLTVRGRRPRPGSVRAALAAGVGFVPQDRHHQGYIPEMSVADNGTLTITDRLGRSGLISHRRRDALAAAQIENLAIKTYGPAQHVSGLSGGNQQKVVMARALAADPGLLVLINPTAGVDVRSKEFLLDKVEETAAGGTGVLIASDELDDLRVCDRVVVMFAGRTVAELERGWHDHALVAAMEGVGAGMGEGTEFDA